MLPTRHGLSLSVDVSLYIILQSCPSLIVAGYDWLRATRLSVIRTLASARHVRFPYKVCDLALDMLTTTVYTLVYDPRYKDWR
jgi:hypothetical protein